MKICSREIGISPSDNDRNAWIFAAKHGIHPITQSSRHGYMSIELHFNDQRCEVAPGPSLFDCAETLGVKVPTSCRKQGKCKECLVEITEGMDLLCPRVPEESHLR